MRQQTQPPGRRHGVPGRRLLLTVLLAGSAVLVPGLASAGFSGGSGATVNVGTATVLPPTSATVATTCPHGKDDGSAKVTFPDVPLATGYVVTLTSARTAAESVVVTSGSTGATFSFAKKGSYTVGVATQRSTWSSSEVTRSFSC